MPTVLSLIVYDESAPEGQGEVAALHLRPGLPTSSTMALALQLAAMGQQMASAPGPQQYGPPGPATLPPLPDQTLAVPARGSGRGKG